MKNGMIPHHFEESIISGMLFLENYREASRTVDKCSGVEATPMKEENAVSITLEAVDAGDNLPPWFIDALANGVADELLILHPNEASRNQTLLRLAQSNCSANTTHHHKL